MKEEILSITRQTAFAGPRKVGLDSGMLISLIDNRHLFSEYILKIDNEKGLLFTHEICVGEAVNVLSRDYGFSEKQARSEIELFLKERSIAVLPRDKSNANTVRAMYRKCKSAGIEFHPPDCFIIADFYKDGINKVYSNNNHFLDACRLFSMGTSKLRTKEKELERKIRQIFTKRRR